MATDALVTVQASVTKTASFNGAFVSMPTGSPFRSMYVRVIYSAATNASGSNSVTFGVDVTNDGGTTWFSDFVDAVEVINLSTTAQSGEIFIPFKLRPGIENGFRLVQVVAGAGSTPTITYKGDLVDARP